MTRCSGRRGYPEALTGFVGDRELACAPDQTFEVVLSARHHGHNWVPMTEGTDAVLVRELFSAPDGAVPSVMAIERLGEPATVPLLTCRDVTAALAAAASEALGLLERYGEWSRRCAARPNTLSSKDELLAPGEVLRVGGSPEIDYHLGYWQLAAGQALVVDVAARGATWGFQLMNHWQENLSAPTCASHLNSATAVADVDGGTRIVVCERNPGHANWVGTDGHSHGVMLFRWLGGGAGAAPATSVVPFTGVPRAEGASRAPRRRDAVAPGYLGAEIG